MKPEELMIGDWVCVRDCETYERVESISPARISTDCSDDLLLDDNIEPVPITPEILEKNGICYWSVPSDGVHSAIDGYRYSRKAGDIVIALRSVTLGWELSVRNCTVTKCYRNIIRYYDGYVSCVHELQHIIRACEIDKQIEI